MDINNFIDYTPEDRLLEIEQFEYMIDLVDRAVVLNGSEVLAQQVDKMIMQLTNAYFYHYELMDKEERDAVYS